MTVNWMKKSLRTGSLAGFVLALALLLGTCVPVNRAFRSVPAGIPVFVVSNGFHTDVVLPLREQRTGTNWLTWLENPTWARQFSTYQYVAMGWGSSGFYMASYGGHLPGVGTVLRALVPGPTLMHVDFYQAAPRPGLRAVALRVSEAQYQQLVSYVQASFERDSTGRLMPIAQAGYTPEDFFLQANGKYHALRTCNDWTNQGLKQAGIRAAWKAPLAGSVIYQARKGSE